MRSHVLAIDVVLSDVRQTAIDAGYASVEITVRADGRVEFRCINRSGFTETLVRADLAEGFPDLRPSRAFALKEIP